MKKLLFLFVLACFFPLVFSQSSDANIPTPYCEASLAQFSEAELAGLGITPEMISSILPCDCYAAVTQYSQWLNDFCFTKKLQQTRFSFDLTPPDCDVFSRTTEKQLVEDERCDTCEDPVSIGNWVFAGCMDGKPLEQRQLRAEMFDTQGECVQGDFVEVRVNQQGQCSAFGFMGLETIAIILGIIAMVLVSLLIILIKFGKTKRR